MKRFLKAEAVVFDLDYTIFDEYTYFQFVFKDFCHSINHSHKLSKLNDDYVSLRPKSANIFRELLNINDLDFNNNNDILFNIYLNISCEIKPYPDVLPFIDELRKSNIKIGLLSNGNIIAQANKVKNLGISNYFDEIVYARSFGEQFEKPDISSFVHIKKILNTNNIIFIGDNPKTDFKGAKEVGGTTFRIKRGLYKDISSGNDVDFEISSFFDLN